MPLDTDLLIIGAGPTGLFAAYYEHRYNAPPSKELQQLFDQVHEEATR